MLRLHGRALRLVPSQQSLAFTSKLFVERGFAGFAAGTNSRFGADALRHEQR